MLWRSVKVRLQFTCDLHLHVVPGDRFVLNTQKAASEVKGYDVVLLCARIYTGKQRVKQLCEVP